MPMKVPAALRGTVAKTTQLPSNGKENADVRMRYAATGTERARAT